MNTTHGNQSTRIDRGLSGKLATALPGGLGRSPRAAGTQEPDLLNAMEQFERAIHFSTGPIARHRQALLDLLAQAAMAPGAWLERDTAAWHGRVIKRVSLPAYPHELLVGWAGGDCASARPLRIEDSSLHESGHHGALWIINRCIAETAYDKLVNESIISLGHARSMMGATWSPSPYLAQPPHSTRLDAPQQMRSPLRSGALR